MEPVVVIRENWLTHKPNPAAYYTTILMTILLFAANYYLLPQFSNTTENWIATPTEVFNLHHYWKAWSTLFAHADLEHLLSNAILFIPLTYLLAGYYGLVFFPVLGLFIGGLVNLLVLKTLDDGTSLLGISGVVYWMGATWLTLFVLIDRRKKLRYRFAIALFLSLFLFLPDKYQPHISYLSHLLGFLFGILSGAVYYLIRRQKILSSERVEILYEDNNTPMTDPLLENRQPTDLTSFQAKE